MSFFWYVHVLFYEMWHYTKKNELLAFISHAIIVNVIAIMNNIF